MAAVHAGQRCVICHAQQATVPQQKFSRLTDKPAQQRLSQQQPHEAPKRPAPPHIITANRRTILGLTAIAACTCCMPPAQAANLFSYGHQDGPPSWGGTCSSGTAQSPVNISTADTDSAGGARRSGGMSVHYKQLRDASVLNSGHGAQVNMPPGNILHVGEQRWEMVQFHFHTPSEHAIDGRHANMEVHLVHQNKDTGSLAVLAVMLETADAADVACAALQQALQHVPSDTGANSSCFDLTANTFSSLLGTGGSDRNGDFSFASEVRRPWVHYSGSLTTPPCSEGVQWYVLTRPAQVASAQVLAFQRLLGGGMTLDTNARPAQALHGRRFNYEGSGSEGIERF